MAYRITITEEAESHLDALSKRDQQTLQAAILTRLANAPATPTRAIKQLRPNPLAKFELRAGDLRVLYNVEGEDVILLVIGRKVGNKLVVKGEEFHGHQDNPTEQPGSGPQGDVE